MKKVLLFFIAILSMLLVACNGEGNGQTDAENKEEALTSVSFVLDWTPNTNHTGIYVAKEKGYFEEAGLDVEIMLPGEVGTPQLLASEQADFGVSYQESLTIARHEGLPIVSIAAVIQHNTAGYASPAEENITKPKDFEGKVFGAYGSDLEKAMMATIMEENGADISKVEFKNIGDADYFTAVKRDIDFSLVFQGWTGIEAEIRGQDLNMVYLKDFSEALDFYTPVLATNEKLIKDKPELVEKFVHAAVKGYQYAIEHPEEAADILIESEPDLNPELVKRSQKWLSTKYLDDAEQFGIQERERWEKTTEFMVEHEIIPEAIQIDDAFTNDFLPKK